MRISRSKFKYGLLFYDLLHDTVCAFNAAYAIYMIIAIRQMKKGFKATIQTPDEKTFRFGFLVVIIITLAFLAFGLRENLSEGVLALIGTLAGYVLGGYRPKKDKNANIEMQA